MSKAETFFRLKPDNSWHIVRTLREGVTGLSIVSTTCGRTYSVNFNSSLARVRASLPANEKSCETCLRIQEFHEVHG